MWLLAEIYLDPKASPATSMWRTTWSWGAACRSSHPPKSAVGTLTLCRGLRAGTNMVPAAAPVVPRRLSWPNGSP